MSFGWNKAISFYPIQYLCTPFRRRENQYNQYTKHKTQTRLITLRYVHDSPSNIETMSSLRNTKTAMLTTYQSNPQTQVRPIVGFRCTSHENWSSVLEGWSARDGNARRGLWGIMKLICATRKKLIDRQTIAYPIHSFMYFRHPGVAGGGYDRGCSARQLS